MDNRQQNSTPLLLLEAETPLKLTVQFLKKTNQFLIVCLLSSASKTLPMVAASTYTGIRFRPLAVGEKTYQRRSSSTNAKK
jgi:hypothetical protein